MNKKIIYIVIIAIVACTGVIIGKNMTNNENTVETSKNYNNVLTENKIVNGVNIVENELKNEIISDLENKVENVEIEDAQRNLEEKEDANKEDNKEKAIEIAKKEWGEDDSVYFEFDEIVSNGNYRIAVRQKSTTNTLVWYIVDIENGKVIDE